MFDNARIWDSSFCEIYNRISLIIRHIKCLLLETHCAIIQLSKSITEVFINLTCKNKLSTLNIKV